MWEHTRVCKYGACGFLLQKYGCGGSLQGCRSVLFFCKPSEYCVSMR